MTTQTDKKIKHLMIEKGVSGAEIARRAGVVRQAIYNVVAGYRKSPHLRQAIAEALEVPINSLWPTEPQGVRPQTEGSLRPVPYQIRINSNSRKRRREYPKNSNSLLPLSLDS